ncbi:MAG TPA: purine/pyrimidine permease [Peptococcaceae bacterium]|nr:purine/pyrimidine permease [Peptococcaceae bacterium]
MQNLDVKYGLEDKPAWPKMLLFGFQWLVIAMPMIIIVGKVVATLQFTNPAQQIIYLQKVFFVIGLSILLQILWGHKLPLIIGPAAVLVVGITASLSDNLSTVYSSIFLGGLILAVLSASGLFAYLKRLFTPRVIVTILMLIAFTLTPKIIDLLLPNDPQVSALSQLIFGLTFVFSMFLANKLFRGIWKSTLIIWGMLVASLIYFLLFPHTFHLNQTSSRFFSGFFQDFNTTISLDAGTLIAFLICYLALAINDLGSIQSIGQMLKTEEMPKRTSRGITLTGILNMLSGFLGVIGPVNYSLSPGVIASTGVASRFTLLPAGIGLMALAFIPPAINLIGTIPSVVIGGAFIYTLCSQFAAGLLLAFNSMTDFKLENGLVLGLPLMLSVIISYLPEGAVLSFPLWLRPILGNGFVIGVLTVLIMEHVIYSEKK